MTSSSVTTKSRGWCTCARPRGSGGATSASTAIASRRCGGLLGGLDLRAVEQAPRRRVEGIAPVQRAAVVSHDDVADLGTERLGEPGDANRHASSTITGWWSEARLSPSTEIERRRGTKTSVTKT